MNRPEYLASLRKSRNSVNTREETWAFSPDSRCAQFAQTTRLPAREGTEILICSDGFLALAIDYRQYEIDALMALALARGLKPLFEELRAIEKSDPKGRQFPRFKTSDDATALVLRVLAP